MLPHVPHHCSAQACRRVLVAVRDGAHPAANTFHGEAPRGAGYAVVPDLLADVQQQVIHEPDSRLRHGQVAVHAAQQTVHTDQGRFCNLPTGDDIQRMRQWQQHLSPFLCTINTGGQSHRSRGAEEAVPDQGQGAVPWRCMGAAVPWW